MDAQHREIGFDQFHHPRHGLLAEQWQPFILWRSAVLVAKLCGQRRADRLQIIAGIKAIGNRANIITQRLTISQVHRAREHIDLPARIIDVIFADHAVPGPFEQAGQRIAHHRAAAMAHVHRPGRVGRDIFDIDPAACTNAGTAILIAQRGDGLELGQPRAGRKPQVDEPRPGNVGADDRRLRTQLGGNRLGQATRIGACALGQHHSRVGRQIAMRRIARRFERDIGERRASRQHAFCHQFTQHGFDQRRIGGIKGCGLVHLFPVRSREGGSLFDKIPAFAGTRMIFKCD